VDKMRDITHKVKTLRVAVAKAILHAKPETIRLIQERELPKGDALTVAKVAAVQSAKNTFQLIPFCHPIPIDFVDVEYSFSENQVEIKVTVKAIAKTGVEMEALTAASVCALTIYDMAKMVDETMRISEIALLEKKGGMSDFAEKIEKPLRSAVLVMSDSIFAGTKSDKSGQLIVERLNGEGLEVVDYKIIPDDAKVIKDTLLAYADEMKLDLVITTGGTGFSPRDVTPEVMKGIIEREAPGISEALRAYGQERTPYSMLSRASAGIRGNTLIINLPGSKKGVAESLDALFPFVLHAFKMIAGGGHNDKKGM